MRRARWLVLGLGLLCLLGVAGHLASTAVEAMDPVPNPDLRVMTMLREDVPFDASVERAEIIVVGTVAGLGDPVTSVPRPESADDPLGSITTVWTPVTIAVEQALKGKAKPGDSLPFAQLGGKSGQVVSLFPGEATFRRGERVLVLLYRPSGLFIQWTGGNLYAPEGMYVVGCDGWTRNSARAEEISLESLVSAITAIVSRH